MSRVKLAHSRRGAVSSITLAWIALGTLAFSGCAMPGKSIEPTSAIAEPANEKHAEPLKPTSEAPTDQKTLAAIEDFLARTQQYRQTSPPLVTANPSPSAPPKPTTQQAPIQPLAAPARGLDPEATPAAMPKALANAELATDGSAESQQVLPVPAVEGVTIRWDESSKSEVAPVSTNAANTPMSASPGGREPAAKTLLSELDKSAESRTDFDSYWRLKMGQLAVGDEEDAAQTVTQLPTDSSSLLSALIVAAVAVRDAAADPLDEGHAALEKIDALRAMVAQGADPIVSGVALCRKVVTFGVYEEMPPEEFVSGRTIQLIVYSEVGNFRSRKTDESAYETQLATRLEVFTKEGESVWQREEPEVVDACRNLRRDFFIAQRVTLPPTLPAGDYVLKVRVEDKLASKGSEAVRLFTIHSPISVAKKP